MTAWSAARSFAATPLSSRRTRSSINGETISAERIFINVGGRANVPAMPGIDKVSYLTNSTIMDIDFLPEHLVIVGGSYIGLEFAQMYRRFGAKVTVVEKGSRLISSGRPRYLRGHQGDPRGGRHRLPPEGRMHIASPRTKRASPSASTAISATARCWHPCAARHRPQAEHRRSRPRRGRRRRPTSAATSPSTTSCAPASQHIYALGDCNGRGAFTHTAYNDFEIVAANLLDDDSRRVSDRKAAYALYIDPPLGRAGMTETEAKKSGRNILVGTRPMTQVGRAVERGETKGFMKIVADADTKELLGAALLGASGDEVVHGILDMIYAKAPYTVMQRMVPIHPTVSELLPTVIADMKPAV